MWGIAAVAVVDRWGDLAFLKFFFDTSGCPPSFPHCVPPCTLSARRPSFLEVLSSSNYSNACSSEPISTVPTAVKSGPSSFVPYSSALESVFHVVPDDAVAIYLLLFAALDRSDSVMIEEARKRFASEMERVGGAALKHWALAVAQKPAGREWKRNMPGEKDDVPEDSKKRMHGAVSSAPPALMSIAGYSSRHPHLPLRADIPLTWSRRRTEPYVEWEGAGEFPHTPTFMRSGFYRRTLREEGCNEVPGQEYGSISSSAFSRVHPQGIYSSLPSSCPLGSPSRFVHQSSEFSLFSGEEFTTASNALPRPFDSPSHTDSESLQTPWGSERGPLELTAYPLSKSTASKDCHTASTTTSTPLSSGTPSSCTSTLTTTESTSTSFSADSLPSTDETLHFSCHSSGPLPPPLLHNPSCYSSLWQNANPHRRGEEVNLHGGTSTISRATQHDEIYPGLQNMFSSSIQTSHRLEQPRMEESKEKIKVLLKSTVLEWKSAPLSFPSFGTSGNLSPSSGFSAVGESMGTGIPISTESQYLGKVAASPDDRFQCYASCAGNGTRVFVVTVSRRRRCTVGQNSSYHSSSSSMDPDELEDAEGIGELDNRGQSSSSLECEGDPVDDAMTPITRSILESVSVAASNPLRSSFLLTFSDSNNPPQEKSDGVFLSAEPLVFSTPLRHSILPSLPHLKVVLKHSRSFHALLERIIGSLELKQQQ